MRKLSKQEKQAKAIIDDIFKSAASSRNPTEARREKWEYYGNQLYEFANGKIEFFDKDRKKAEELEAKGFKNPLPKEDRFISDVILKKEVDVYSFSKQVSVFIYEIQDSAGITFEDNLNFGYSFQK